MAARSQENAEGSATGSPVSQNVPRSEPRQHVLPQFGGSVPETIPPHYSVILGENPANVVDAPVISFKPKILPPGESDLDFWPTILKPIPTVLLMLLYTSTASAIGVLYWRAGVDREFHVSSENVHMIARYFPSVLGTITVLFFRQSVREFIRMTPYVNMADQSQIQRPGAIPWKSVSGAFFPWQDITTSRSLIPCLSLFCQFIASFIVSLKVALFATVQHGATWTLTVRAYPAFALVCGYVIMASYTLFIAWHFRGKSTGLKWDPISIADFMALFAHCNALEYFEKLELRHERSARDLVSPAQYFRLGYWNKTMPDPQDSSKTVAEDVYGIGIGFHAETDGIVETTIAPERHWYRLWIAGDQAPDPVPLEDHPTCKPRRWPRKQCEHYPYRHNPGCSRILLMVSTLIVWASFAAAIFALVRGWPFHGFSLPNNLSLPSNITISVDNNTYVPPPIDPNDPKSTLLVYALLFKSAPTYIAGLFVTIVIDSVDLNMRFLQPFLNMFKEKPAEADESILLSYITLSPIQVPLTAYDKGHYKVSWYSTLSTISPLFPIFVGGLLTVSRDNKRVDFSFSMSAYIGIMAALALYVVSIPAAALPRPHRLLPRQFYSMADLMAVCHQAKFLGSPHLNITDRKRTPTKEHMEARIRLTGDRFLFGKYRGRDGKLHLGFDVEETREPDFGPILSYNQVERIVPSGWNWIVREKARVATLRAKTIVGGTFGPGKGKDALKARGGHFTKKAREVHDANGTSISMGSGRPTPDSHQVFGSPTGSDAQQGGFGGRVRTVVGFEPPAN